MIKFEKTPIEGEEVDHTCIMFGMDNNVTLSYIVEEFEYFLKATGYHFDGKIMIVEDEINETDIRD